MVLDFIVLVADTIIGIFKSIPFSTATWIVIGVLMFFVFLFAKAHQNPDSPVRWEHLITDSYNNRTSPYKLGYLIGLIVATWLVVFLANKEDNHLSFDIFAAYLAYLLGGAGWNSYMKNKMVNSDTSSHDQQHRNSRSTDQDLYENNVKPPR